MSETYANMKLKLQRDLDLEGEDFIQDTELLALFNDAIRECEAHIHKLGLDDTYFLDYDTVNMVTGVAEYDLPENIYLNKFKGCVYNNNDRVFYVDEMRSSQRLLEKAIIDNESVNDPVYQYFLRNSTAADGTKWVLHPAAKETASYITRWYIRKVAPLTASTSICDVPDVCLNFIYAYVAWRVWGKEGDARAADAKNERDMQKTLMLDTLSEMVPDEEKEIEIDTSIYEEMS